MAPRSPSSLCWSSPRSLWPALGVCSASASPAPTARPCSAPSCSWASSSWPPGASPPHCPCPTPRGTIRPTTSTWSTLWSRRSNITRPLRHAAMTNQYHTLCHG